MIASYLGLVLGQLILVVHPELGLELLMLVAMCFALCLVPVAMTRRIHPAPLRPAPMEPKFFIKRVPQSLSTVLGSGLIVGSFYGLAPLYAASQGLSTEQIGLFMGCCIFAGLVVQWPLGWLSDRYDRAVLIRSVAVGLAVTAAPLAILPDVPLELLFAMGFVVSLLQFSLYPLAVAFSNDHVESERRVSLTAMLLVTYGVGACWGCRCCTPSSYSLPWCWSGASVQKPLLACTRSRMPLWATSPCPPPARPCRQRWTHVWMSRPCRM